MNMRVNSIESEKKSSKKSEEPKKRFRLMTGKPGGRRNLNVAKLATALGTSASQADKTLSKQMMAINILNEDDQSIEHDKLAVPTMKQRHRSRDNLQSMREKLNNSTLI